MRAWGGKDIGRTSRGFTASEALFRKLLRMYRVDIRIQTSHFRHCTYHLSIFDQDNMGF